MKILELHLKRYGPFTDRLLDLSAGDHGLHVVFGRNEAGKSTTLRALVNLLFGIEHNTRDAFLHGTGRLRIGGRLRHSSGEEYAFVRKKGRTKTILSPDDEHPLDEGALNLFLGGVDRALFTKLFGIGHADLVTGGKAILEQGGELGTALFSAALGTARLRTLLEDLRRSADEIYRPRGKKQIINALAHNYKEEMKKVKSATLHAGAWNDLQKAIKRVDAEIEETKTRLEKAIAEESRLKRAQRVLRPLRNLDAVRIELEAMGDVVDLPDDFGEERRAAENKRRNAMETRTKLDLRLAAIKKELDAIEIDEVLLSRAADIRDLSEGLGAYKKARRDLPTQDARRREQKSQARDLLRAYSPTLSLADLSTIEPQFARRKMIQELRDDDRALSVEEANNHKILRSLGEKIERIERELAEQPPPAESEALAAAVASARRVGDIDERIDELRMKVSTLSTKCAIDLDRLGLWTGEPADFQKLPLPLSATIERFEKDFASMEDEIRDLKRRLAELAESREEIERALADLQADGEVPTKEELEQARAHRTKGWRLIRRAWLDAEALEEEAAAYDAQRPLAEAYEHSVERADHIADTMYRDVERVEQKREQTARLAAVRETSARLEQQLTDALRKERNLQSEWLALWAGVGIMPLSAREMRSWLSKADALLGKLESLDTLNQEREELERSRGRELEALREALAASAFSLAPEGDDRRLAPVLNRAEEHLGMLHERREASRALRAGLDEARAERKQAEREARELRARRERWTESWRKAVSWLELPEDPSSTEVGLALEQLEKVFELWHAIEKQDRRIYGIERDIEEFEARVNAFAEEIGLTLENPTPAAIVETLLDGVNAAEKARERRKALDDQRRTLAGERAELNADIAAAEARLAELRAQAGARDDDELDQAEKRAARRRELLKQKMELEQQLQDNGDGYSVDELREEIREKNIDTLPAEIAEQVDVVKDLRAELEERKAHRLELKMRSEEMRNLAGAAEAQERAHQCLAEMRTAVERYLLAKSAVTMLEEQIERFRREHQTPLLARAGRLFSQLTLGAYKGLRDDLDDKGTPIVIGVRSDDTEVHVEGMSDGTCDQLFLALRLAALERHLRSSEPMPFIVDDILIGFDDDRSRAALEVLGGLASLTQVLLFTHHARIVELAAALRPEAGVFVHDLRR